MVSTSKSPTRTPDLTPDPTTCPFCGQPLLNTLAVEHLARQEAAYEAELRKDLEAEAEARAQARVKKVEKDLKADAAEQVQAAARGRAEEVAGLNRQLQEVQKNQEAKVKVEVRKQVADAEASQRTRLEQEFGKREKQVQATLTKVQEQNAELSRRVERLSAGDRGEFNEEEILAQLSRAFPDDDIKRTRRGQRGADIFQHVRVRTDGDFIEAGLIIYECKDTLSVFHPDPTSLA
jgi:DNA repair exonuclease SbcCD ATPase subunit